MLPALAEIEDLERRLGKPVPSDQVQRAQAALDDASTLVRVEVDQTWVDALGDLTSDVPDIAVTVAVAVAHRCFVGESVVDESSLGAQMVNAPTRRPLYLTGTERRALGRIRVGASGLTSISTTRGDEFGFDDTVWVPVEGSTNAFPMLSADDLI